MEARRHDPSVRRWVWWLTAVTALVAVAVQVVEGPPGSGYGWGSVVISSLLLAVPLAAVALMVRSGERRFAWPAVVVVALVTVVVLLALVGNWSGQTSTFRTLDSLVACLVVMATTGVLVVELPLLRQPEQHRDPRGGPGPHARV